MHHIFVMHLVDLTVMYFIDLIYLCICRREVWCT